ncbi:D-aminoacyl-tRNA deacylase [soil metagenome]
MRLLLQRVTRAEVRVEDRLVAAIGLGLMVLVGVGSDDTPPLADRLAARVADLRIFRDEAGKTNRSLLEVGGSALAVSQFTLHADTRRGRRPSFTAAGDAVLAREIYEIFCTALQDRGVAVGRGVFGAEMQVELVNDGPMTIWLDSEAQ